MLDSSIAMGVKPVQFENPLNSLAQILQIKGAQNQNRLADLTFQQHQQALDETNALNSLYAGAMSPGGQIDREKLYQGAASSNLGSKIPGLQKGFADMDAGQVKVDAEKFKLANDRVKGYKSDLGALYQDPTLTKEKAIARMQSRLQQGLISQEMYQHIVSDLPDDPAALREQLGQGIKEQLSPEQALTLFAPKTEYKDNGQKLIPVQTNPLAPGYVAPTEIQKLATPEALLTDSRTRSEGALNRGVQIRGQDLVEGRAKLTSDGAKIPSGYRHAADGISLEAIPGGPADKGNNATEGERKAATLLQRLEFSSKQLDAARKAKPSATTPNVLSNGLEMIGADSLANAVQSPERQRIEGAQLDMLDAALTLGTGAAYTREQLKGYAKSYFPQVNDDPATIRDKNERLKNIVEAAKIAAGRASKSVKVDGDVGGSKSGFKYLGSE